MGHCNWEDLKQKNDINIYELYVFKRHVVQH